MRVKENKRQRGPVIVVSFLGIENLRNNHHCVPVGGQMNKSQKGIEFDFMVLGCYQIVQ
jgi:hypothetical protein